MEENELVEPMRGRPPSEEDQGENSTVCEQVRETLLIKCVYNYFSLHRLASLNALQDK